MSAIENVYNELATAQRKRRDDNEKIRRRRELVSMAGNTLIGLYKAGMEEKADNFFQNANVIKGRNVYNKAQNLDKAFADHETNAATYITGEKGYVYDTFVMPYAQKLAEQEYAGWADGYTDESKKKVLKDFADKFQDDIYTKYKNIQALRGRVDLSKNFEDFVKDANVFPDSMGQELIGKIFGNKKNKAEILLESGENVLKKLSPDIFNLGGQKIFQEDGFENAKGFMESAKAQLEAKYNVTQRNVSIPTLKIDGQTIAEELVNVEVNALDDTQVRFRSLRTGEVIPFSQLKGTYQVKREVVTKDSRGIETQSYVYDTYINTSDGVKVKVLSGQGTDAQDAKNVNLNDYSIGTPLGTYDKDIPIFIESISGRKFDDDNTVAEIRDAQRKAMDLETEEYNKTFTDAVKAEAWKLENSFDTENATAQEIAHRVVLNRWQKMTKDGEYDTTKSFFVKNKSGVYGKANGLEALEAYADLVYEEKITINGDTLRDLGRLLTNSKAVEQKDNLLLYGKDQIIKDLFNKESVRNLFTEKYLRENLVTESQGDMAITVGVMLNAWEEFGQKPVVIGDPKDDVEVKRNLNPRGISGPADQEDKKPTLEDWNKALGDLSKVDKDTLSYRQKLVGTSKTSLDPNRFSLVQQQQARKDDIPTRTPTSLAPLEVVKAAIADRDKSKYDVAMIGIGSLMDSGGRAFAQGATEDARAIADAAGKGVETVGKGVNAYKQIVYDILKEEVEPWKAAYDYVFVPPSQRESSETIDMKKLEALAEGLNEESRTELIDKVTMIANQQDDKEDTGSSLLQRPDEDAITIPDSVEDKVEFVGNLFNDSDKEIKFMKRLVNQESLFGKAPGTYTLAGKPGRRGSYGVAQVDEVAFNQVLKKLKSRRNKLSKYVQPFKDKTGIDLREVKYEDLDNDLLSIAFGRMYLLQRTNAPIPKSKRKQGDYWKKYYNTSAGAGTAMDFITINSDI